ncbi:glycoside hydrolase domain-containing protein [Streptomyces rectiverticillatus]|uniref:glycoside hydrolase domain-containing protein n=1 Tax=Streptomyces rectiverticillatus TaxID=173860 RepID=UPI001FE78CB4|nr:glycoside hydrolase domain-containing protein [Streptomyces rectiverticillatus]
MDRRRKIIGYLLALMAVAAQLMGAEPAGAGDRGDPRDEGASVFRGWGMDTCQAPALTTLSAWKSSDYRAVGVYFAGRARACPRQTYLSERWLEGADDLGWRVLPIYVGSQSPCVRASNKRGFLIGSYPYDQGQSEGEEAVSRASALGIVSRSALYLDMEAYDDKDGDCARTTLSFIRGWGAAVRSAGYLPGFYSSAESGVRHMDRARRSGTTGLPDVLWFARWRVAATTDGEPSIGRTAWQPHRRIHQYQGNVAESHGGRKLTIDRNLVDAPVAIID